MKSEMHMSNLKLPLLSYENIKTILERSGKSRVAVAYATEVMQQVHGVAVLHHGSVIAEMNGVDLELNNHGYDSQTTAKRMDHVLRDNGYTERVAIRQREMTVLNSDLTIRHRGFRTIKATTSKAGNRTVITSV